VAAFAGNASLIRARSELPLAKQRDYAWGEELVVVVTVLPNGRFASEKLPAHRLTSSDIALVFDRGHIRSTEEQLPLLNDRARRRARRKPVTIELKLSAVEHAELVTAAKAKRVHVATLILDTLRAQALLGARS